MLQKFINKLIPRQNKLFPDKKNDEIIYIERIYIDNIKCIEKIQGKIYTLKDNSIQELYYNSKTKSYILVKVQNINKQCECIFSHANKLYVMYATDTAKYAIGYLNNENFVELPFTFDKVIHGYLNLTDKTIFYTFGGNNIKSCLFSLKNDNSLAEIHLDIEYKNINCINCDSKYFYIACTKPNRVYAFGIDNIYDESSRLSKNAIKKEIDVNCYSLINYNNNVYLGADGPTIVYNDKLGIEFKDEEMKNSGYQIGAAAQINLEIPYEILGTWRRDVDHPLACLYVLIKNKLIYKNAINLENQKPWTGYNTFNKRLIRNDVFFTCDDGYPVRIRAYKSYEEFKDKIDIRNVICRGINKNLYIFENTNPEKESKHETKSRISHGYITPTSDFNFYITIDVEQRHKGEPYRLIGKIGDKEGGINLILDMLDSLSLKGVFFVNVYEFTYYDNLIENIIKNIYDRGHEIGLHYHHNIDSFNKQLLSEYSYEEQREILGFGVNFIKRITGEAPISFRGGGYDINEDTFKALKDVGIKIDSSVFLAVKQKIKYKTKNALTEYDGILELPVTTVMRELTPSKIDINWISNSSLLIDYVKTCKNYGLRNIVSMLHSYSFIKFTNIKTNIHFYDKIFVKGINYSLINQFKNFLKLLYDIPGIRIKTFKQAFDDGDLAHSEILDKDVIPFVKISDYQDSICPICQSIINTNNIVNNNSQICTTCLSDDITRFIYVYIDNNLNYNKNIRKQIIQFDTEDRSNQYLSKYIDHDYFFVNILSDTGLKCNIENIYFNDEIFDIVIGITVLDHVLDDWKAISEMHRVLKKGGKMLLCVGAMEDEKTLEKFNRDDFPKMVVGDLSYPENLDQPILKESDGKIYYNPRYVTRIYGKDIVQRLEDGGFEVRILRPEDFEYANKYAIRNGNILLECTKL